MQVRELEEEIEALAVGKEHRRALKELMNKKELVGDLFNNLRLTRQRLNDSARAHSSTIPTPAKGSSSATLSSRSSSGSAEETGDSWQVISDTEHSRARLSLMLQSAHIGLGTFPPPDGALISASAALSVLEQK